MNQFSPRLVKPRTEWFSATVSNRKDLKAVDYSVISGLKAENNLISQELQQLRKTNEKLMVKIDDFEK